MEEPEASTQSGEAPAAARSADAIVAGCTVDISGLPVRLVAADRERAERLAAALGRLPAHPAEPAIEVSFGLPLPRVPEAPPDEAYADAFFLWRRSDELYLAYGPSTAGHATPHGVVFGGEPVAQLRHLVPLALGHVLGFNERFVLHAGVITSGSRTALVLGDSGAGKSTVVIAARESGWTALGDDMAVLRAEGDGVVATTLGAPLAFPGELWSSPLEGSTALDGDPRQRRTTPAPSPGVARVVTDLIVPRHDTASDGSLEPLAALARFEKAIGSFVAATEPELVRRFAPVGSALARCRGWLLGLPPDPATRLTATGALLAKLVAIDGSC